MLSKVATPIKGVHRSIDEEGGGKNEEQTLEKVHLDEKDSEMERAPSGMIDSWILFFFSSTLVCLADWTH